MLIFYPHPPKTSPYHDAQKREKNRFTYHQVLKYCFTFKLHVDNNWSLICITLESKTELEKTYEKLLKTGKKEQKEKEEKSKWNFQRKKKVSGISKGRKE